MNRPYAKTEARSGMTLVEVLLATVILGVCIVGLMKALSMCAEIFRGAAFWQNVATVAARGEETYPFVVSDNPEEDLSVAPDGSLAEDWTYERIVEDDDDDDGIRTVRIRIVYRDGGPGAEAEFTRLIYTPDAMPSAGGREITGLGNGGKTEKAGSGRGGSSGGFVIKSGESNK